MPSTFLEQWFDPASEPPEDFDETAFVEQHVERMHRYALIAQLAYDRPRRLGQDATPKELSRDKKLCKKLNRRWRSIAPLFPGTQPADYEEFSVLHAESQEFMAKAAQIDWSEALPDYFATLRTELALMATVGIKGKKHRICNQIGNRIYNELIQINQVFEEFGPESSN